ncbi:MAG: ABC transporter permease [Balneolaceae bacterium]
MLKNYFKIALRNLFRNKSYSFINILGLALGVSSCLFIFLYVQNELSYDNFHENSDRIYRIAQEANQRQGFSWVGSGAANDLKADFPEIETVIRLHRSASLVSYQDDTKGINNSFKEDYFMFSDPDLFDIFTIPILQGDKISMLEGLNKVVISESAALKYFGAENPIGKTLLLENSFPLTVTAVFQDVPDNSHLEFDLVSTYSTLKKTFGYPTSGFFDSYWWPISWTYILLNDGASAEEIQSQLGEFALRHRDADEAALYSFILQPVKDIYLNSGLSGEIKAGGSTSTIYIFSGIAIIILLIGCINFMNLSTARSSKRSREVGVRKSLGASKNQLVLQFLGESFIITFLAISISIVLIELFMPLFGQISGKVIEVNYFQNYQFWIGLVSIVSIIALLAGLYPAFFLSAFNPSKVLKGGTGTSNKGVSLRKGLVVVQFSISVILIFGTMITYQQLDYMQNTSLGFDKEETIAISSVNVESRYEIVKENLLKQPGVLSVTGSSVRPGFSDGWSPSYAIEGLQPGENYTMNYQTVDFNFFDQFGVDIVEGRNFSSEYSTESGVTETRNSNIGLYTTTNLPFIVNETAVKEYGWTNESAIGKTIELFTEENGTRYLDVSGEVVGVVEDYHATSLHNKIKPIIYSVAKTVYTESDSYFYGTTVFFVKLAPGNTANAMKILESTWKATIPEWPFIASFLDQDLENLYQSELQISKIITFFAILAIIIACMGLFGLSSFMAEQRVKEIGVRKVLGATVHNLVGLLAFDFVKLVIVAMLISSPFAWVLMENWLSNFAYKINLNPLYLLIAGSIAILIAISTISFQAVKAALINPIESLKSE